MTVVIMTEKPSAKRNFAAALGGVSGNFEGTKYKIVALRGHVMRRPQPHEMVPEDKQTAYRKWLPEYLPWNPKDFAWRKVPAEDTKQVFSDLAEACDTCDELVLACDDDPSGEGSLLGWEALEHVGWQGKTTRMYFADEAPESIKKAFRNRVLLKDGAAGDGDFIKADARERFDFLSMQFSRAATIAAAYRGYRFVVREGRLKSVMTYLVGEQQKAYNEYVKKPFFEIRFKDGNKNVFKRAEDLAQRTTTANELDLDAFHSSKIVIDSEQEKHTQPGKLLDLAALSSILATKGYKPEEVLETYQKMYENQIVSYPRTEDKTITPEQFAELVPLAPKIAKVVGVNPDLLTHTQPRKTIVKDGGAHGANRPGPNVPTNLSDVTKYGASAASIYELLAKNFLAILAEDYEYTLQKAHLLEYPDFTGEARIPRKMGFKAVFDSDKAFAEETAEEDESSGGFTESADPFIFEGANKRPQRPTIKWLIKQLEKYDVGTGATRTSTIAEITKPNKKGTQLLEESKGVLSLAECGEVSYVLLDGCMIASPEVTEELFKDMERIGRFEMAPDALLDKVAPMLTHDFEQMKQNSAKLENPLALEKKTVGACPICGQPIFEGDKVLTCSSNKNKKQDDGTWVRVSGCGFIMFRAFRGKKLTLPQLKHLLAGEKATVKGIARKGGGGTYDAIVQLSLKPNEKGFYPVDMISFPDAATSKAQRKTGRKGTKR